MTAASTDDQSRTAALYVPDLNAGGLDVITKGLIQVWYSTNTLQKLEAEIVHASPLRLACLSCPSVYFHLSEEARAKCGASNFEYDRRWADDKNFVFYDCYAPSNVEESLHGQFDFLIADPPSLRTRPLRSPIILFSTQTDTACPAVSAALISCHVPPPARAETSVLENYATTIRLLAAPGMQPPIKTRVDAH
eukprot:6464348-Prymnesium_polylepis.1